MAFQKTPYQIKIISFVSSMQSNERREHYYAFKEAVGPLASCVPNGTYGIPSFIHWIETMNLVSSRICYFL